MIYKNYLSNLLRKSLRFYILKAKVMCKYKILRKELMEVGEKGICKTEKLFCLQKLWKIIRITKMKNRGKQILKILPKFLI